MWRVIYIILHIRLCLFVSRVRIWCVPCDSLSLCLMIVTVFAGFLELVSFLHAYRSILGAGTRRQNEEVWKTETDTLMGINSRPQSGLQTKKIIRLGEQLLVLTFFWELQFSDIHFLKLGPNLVDSAFCLFTKYNNFIGGC